MMTEDCGNRQISSPPPSYEESLQHQRLEGTNSQEYGVINPAFYRPQSPRLPYTHHGPDVEVRRLQDSEHAQDTYPSSKIMLPPMHMYAAVVIFFFNCIFPGLGTLTAAVALYCFTDPGEWSCSERIHSSLLCLAIALLQMLLTPLFLFGWVWSIFWGLGFLGTSKHDYHGIKDEEVTTTTPGHLGTIPRGNGRSQVQPATPPPPYSGPTQSPPITTEPTSNESANGQPPNGQQNAANCDLNAATADRNIEITAEIHMQNCTSNQHNQVETQRPIVNQTRSGFNDNPVFSTGSTSSANNGFNFDIPGSTLTDVA